MASTAVTDKDTVTATEMSLDTASTSVTRSYNLRRKPRQMGISYAEPSLKSYNMFDDDDDDDESDRIVAPPPPPLPTLPPIQPTITTKKLVKEKSKVVNVAKVKPPPQMIRQQKQLIRKSPSIHIKSVAATPLTDSDKLTDRSFDVGIPFVNLNSFKLIKVLLKPRCLSNDDTCYSICRRDFGSYLHYDSYRIFLRICLYSFNLEKQVDFLPSTFMLKINRSSYCIKNSYKHIPYDITKYVAGEKACKISVQVKLCDYKFIESNYYFGVFLMKKNDHEEMITSLKSKKPVPQRVSIDLLKSLLGTDDGEISISDNSIKVSLLCAISSCRINTPIRSKHCKHLQCFDAENFVRLNNITPRWKCPICRTEIPFNDLFVDGLFSKIILGSPESCTEVLVFQDGTFKYCKEDLSISKRSIEQLDIDDDTPYQSKKVSKKPEIECIVIDDDDDDDDDDDEDVDNVNLTMIHKNLRDDFEMDCPLYPEVILE